MMKEIDVKTWKRRFPYEQFIKYDHPQFSVGTRIDVTKLVKKCKTEKKSFFTSLLYIVTKSVNEVDEMKIRIKDDKIVMFDKINPSSVVMTDEGYIATCLTEYSQDEETFYKRSREGMERVRTQGSLTGGFDATVDNDVIFISCLPWLDIHCVSNPYDISNAEQSSIPRIVWGKYVEENDKMVLGMYIECHHALLDGEPISRVFNKIQDKLNAIE